MALSESPFACDHSALTPEARKHHSDEVVPALRRLVKSRREVPDGYAFELPAESAAILLAAEFASIERLCCPFLDIALRIEREHGKFWLELSGRPGTKEFIREDFAPWFS
ncbi:MAG TPA: hypothetical protein VGL53_18770 [Bryobacteraceae bacterium]